MCAVTLSPETASGAPVAFSIRLVSVAEVAPGGTVKVTSPCFPAHSKTRKIRPFSSSAFLTAVRTTFSGATETYECSSGSEPLCGATCWARSSVVVLVAKPLGAGLLPGSRMRIECIAEALMPLVRIRIGPCGGAQQCEPQRVAHSIVAVLRFVQQAEAMLCVAKIGPAGAGTSNIAFCQELLRSVGRSMLP